MGKTPQYLRANDVKEIAELAFIYGFPMVVGYSVMYEYAIDKEADQFKAPFNRIFNAAQVYTSQDTAVAVPNSDTPYSFVWIDLRAEPVVIRVPMVDRDRYYSVQLVDLYTCNYGYIGSRSTGNESQAFMIAGPRWDGEAPAGVSRVFRCETDFSFVLFRTQLFGPTDLENVKKIQAGYGIETLSAYQKQPPPPAVPAIDWPKFDKKQAEVDPFSYLDFLLRFCPTVGTAAVEKSLREKFARFGIGTGNRSIGEDFPPEMKAEFVAGAKLGLARIEEAAENVGTLVNGWQIGSAAGNRKFYDGNWVLRAAAAKLGIYGASQEEAVYPFTRNDAAGVALDGSQYTYRMTFTAGELPPVRAFWSITMYDGRTQLLINNPINRYLINSPMLDKLKKNPDGSLTIYIQKDSPGKEKEANWLPAPNGPMFIVMRLYWPRTAAPSVYPLGKGSWKPPALVRVGNLTGRGATRFGDKSLEAIIRTDERYGHDGLLQGPRGWAYWNGLEHPRPIQNPNLWPDCQSTYFPFQFNLPAGSSLTLRLEFPHARYCQFALNKAQDNTFVSTGEYLSGPKLEPDEGSTNPFRVAADRLARKRGCTLQIVAKDPPENVAARERNTLYAGKEGGELLAVLRIYLSDQGWDGAGWGTATAPGSQPPFRYQGTLADGTRLSAEEVVRRFARPFEGAIDPPIDAGKWVELVHAKDNDPTLDPATAPARKYPRWEKYWNIKYSILGAFKTAEVRASIPHQTPIDGGGDPTTQYFLLHLSRKFGPVYVMRGRMPTFPDTYAGEDGKGLAVMPDTQIQYWSVVSCEASPSGQISDGLCDMQVPLDLDRNYTIVVSRREDRPANAIVENGVGWLEWPPHGEGLDHPCNREDFAMLMMRIMGTNPNWKERPENVTRPGMEEEVMGPYFPRGEYTDKASFEALGSRISGR